MPVEKGAVKTIHTKLEQLILEAPHGTGRTGKGPVLGYSDDFGPKVHKIPGSKFEGKALNVPANKTLWDDLNNKELAAFQDATIILEKGEEYWNLQRVLPGHQGVAGVVAPGGQSQQQQGVPMQQPKVDWNERDRQQAAGQVRNLAMSLACSRATAKSPVTKEVFFACIREVLSWNEEAKALSLGETATPPTPQQPMQTTGNGQQDFDEDIPF